METKALSELKGHTFHIPSLQRGYKWTTENVNDLLNDFDDFIESSGKKLYCLQPVAVIDCVKEEGYYSVLDGQQRLTTLFLLHKYLFEESPYYFDFERDIENGQSRSDYLNKIGSDEADKQKECNIDWYNIWNAYNTIKQWFKNQPEREEKFRDLLNAGRKEKSVQVIWYEVNKDKGHEVNKDKGHEVNKDKGHEVNKDKGHEVFRNLNSGKIPLNNTELIKSLFLNRSSGLKLETLQGVAAKFEEMERTMQQDHFWYMFSNEEIRSGQNRMDLLFNLVADVSSKEYGKDAYASFRKFDEARMRNELEKKWTDVRHTFLRLMDLYSDIELYHYIGFLTYCKKSSNIKDRLKEYMDLSKSVFKERLRQEIRNNVLDDSHQHISDFTYDNTPKEKLQSLFLLHNIETILQRYKTLKDNKDICLQHEYEWFPFELLYKQNWDIEHIASQTDADFKNEQDREDWLESVEIDIANLYDDKKIMELKDKYQKKKTPDSFRELYNAIIKLGEKDSNALEEDDKNSIGNLVLLDSHTNRSFHNSLFPRKRRIVIMADGLKSANDIEKGVQQVYIPLCTMQCFTKAYSKGSDTKLSIWSKDDADAYKRDIEEKLFDDGKILNK